MGRARQVWNLLSDIQTVQWLLDLLGWRQTAVTLAVAGVAAVVAKMRNLSWPELVLFVSVIGLGTLALVLIVTNEVRKRRKDAPGPHRNRLVAFRNEGAAIKGRLYPEGYFSSEQTDHWERETHRYLRTIDMVDASRFDHPDRDMKDLIIPAELRRDLVAPYQKLQAKLRLLDSIIDRLR